MMKHIGWYSKKNFKTSLTLEMFVHCLMDTSLYALKCDIVNYYNSVLVNLRNDQKEY